MSAKETLTRFVDLVRRMRSAQRAYFARRNNADLEKARALERQVDETIKSMRDRQRRMF